MPIPKTGTEQNQAQPKTEDRTGDAHQPPPASMQTSNNQSAESDRVKHDCSDKCEHPKDSPWFKASVIINAALTLALIAVTGLSAYFIWEQWGAMERTLAVTNRYADAAATQVAITKDSERTYVALVDGEVLPSPDDELRFALDFRNVGRVPAFEVTACITYAIGQTRPQIPCTLPTPTPGTETPNLYAPASRPEQPIRFSVAAALHAGEVQSHEIEIPGQGVGADIMGAIHQGSRGLRIWAHLQFRDASGAFRSQNTCLAYFRVNEREQPTDPFTPCRADRPPQENE